ncbi:MAG: hypothetical protein NWF14_03055 [Candidatus Bathyarchaeota archaeon]|nr:hypothetical protein [Candidatus Bathyarchaeota archaeon]
MVEMSLSKTVQFLIENDPTIQDALVRGYGNYSAIARLLKPKVEEIQGKKVTVEGLITAVKRAKITYAPKNEYQRIVAESSITLRTDVAKISLEKTRRTLEKARLISADFPEAFFQVLEGATALTLITDQRIFDEVRSVFTEEQTLEEKQNLAAIIVQSPRAIVDTPGCVVAFYNPISRAQINIEETISCFAETVIVLSMEDAARAFSLLTDLIANARKAKT